MLEESETFVDIEDLGDEAEFDDSRVTSKTVSAVRKNFSKKNKQDQAEDKAIEERVPGTGKIHVTSYGCSHNMSDAEFMMGQLVDYGYSIVDDPKDADLVLVNSCTVKNPSQKSMLK